MFFFLRENDDFGGIVLQDVGHDAKSNAGCASGDDVDLKIELSATAHVREPGTSERILCQKDLECLCLGQTYFP